MISSQIQALHDEGLDSGQIASELGVSEVTVKSALCRQDNIEFSDADLALARDGIVWTAAQGENERNKLQACLFIYEVRKGLRAPKRDDNTLPITQINQLILAANSDVARFINRSANGQSNGRGNSIVIEGAECAQVVNTQTPAEATASIDGGRTSSPSSSQTTSGVTFNSKV